MTPTPGLPSPQALLLSLRIQEHLHPEGWGHRFEPGGPARDMFHIGLKPCGPAFLCLMGLLTGRPPRWGLSDHSCHPNEKQNPGLHGELT